MRYLSILFFLCTSMAFAGVPVELNGHIEIENKSYFKEPNPDLSDNGKNQAQLFLKVKSPSDQKFRFFSAVELRADEVDSGRNRIFLKEGYINYEEETFDLRVGKQIYSWGKADRINPTNNLNPADYSDLFDTDEEEIGVISLSSRYYLDKLTLETVLIPVFEPAIIPSTNSRWNLFPASLTTLPVEERRPSKDIEHAQLAARLSMSTGGWDYSASYYRGFEKFPSVSLFTSPDTLFLQYRELQVLGGDIATSFDKLGFRGEAGYFMPVGLTGDISKIDDPYLQYVIGLDYNFINLIAEQDLYILGQWIDEIVWQEGNAAQTAEEDIRHLFKKAVMLKTEWAFTDYTKLSLQGIYRIKSQDIYIQPLISSNLVDNVNLEIGFDIFYGKEGSLLKGFKDNQRIFGRLKYSF